MTKGLREPSGQERKLFDHLSIQVQKFSTRELSPTGESERLLEIEDIEVRS